MGSHCLNHSYSFLNLTSDDTAIYHSRRWGVAKSVPERSSDLRNRKRNSYYINKLFGKKQSTTRSSSTVKFSRRYTKIIPGDTRIGTNDQTGTYEEYTAPDIAIARAFLNKKSVTKDFFYIEIITPEGNLGKDKFGIY